MKVPSIVEIEDLSVKQASNGWQLKYGITLILRWKGYEIRISVSPVIGSQRNDGKRIIICSCMLDGNQNPIQTARGKLYI